MTDRKVLGRGLSALIPQRIDEQVQAKAVDLDAAGDGGEKWIYKGKEVVYISLDDIKPNRFQPRRDFKDDKLKELAESIKQKGVLQPVLARRSGEGGFELLAGERRWRASRLAGLDKIPAIIKETKDSDALEISLIENLQRDDLNPMEEARAYKRLMEEFGLGYEKISQVVGKAPSSVNNIMRLLTLAAAVQDALMSGLISTGHAKAILALKDLKAQEKLCDRIIKSNLSVRQAENITSKAKVALPAAGALKKDAEAAALEEDLQRRLGTKVKILINKRGGKIIIEYFSNKDLERIINIIKP